MLCPLCQGMLSIEKVECNGGIDGRYRNWKISCPCCGLINAEYAADSFYGRKYYKTEEDVFEAFQKYCNFIKKGVI